MSIIIGGVLAFVLVAMVVSSFLRKSAEDEDLSETVRFGASIVNSAVFLIAASVLPMFAVTGQITVSTGELVSLQAGVLVFLYVASGEARK